MGKFDLIIEQYTNAGVRIDNIEYAISSVKDGSRREHIIENLTADYRGMSTAQADAMLSDLFAANGGEFRKENRGGYIFGALALIVGITLLAVDIFILPPDEIRLRYLAALVFGVIFIIGGCIILTKAMRGKFRDEDNPF